MKKWVFTILKVCNKLGIIRLFTLIVIMNKTKAVRNTNLLFVFVFPDYTISLILQFFGKVYMMM